MTEYYNIILDILKSKGEEYETRYPEIKEKNVFSISTLAHSSAKQIWWKLDGIRKNNFVSFDMTKGRAMHEFIQKRFPFGVNEYPLLWDCGKYKLIGHCDIVDFKHGVVFDIKTTKDIDRSIERDLKSHIIQLGTYCKIIGFEAGKNYRGILYMINNSLYEYELTEEDIEGSWEIIIARANETYEKIFQGKDQRNIAIVASTITK